MRVRKSSRKIGGMIAALGLLAAACGGSDAASLPTTEPPSETVEQAEVASETETAETPEATETETATEPETAETPAADAGSCTAPEQTGPTLDVGILAQFDTEAGQNADGLTFDSAGNAYVSFAPLGQVARLSADGSPPEVLGTIPGWDDPFPGIGGIVFDTDGNLYAAAAGSADTTGVWVFECGNGEPTRISGTEAMGFPNDLVFDDAGNLFVSDLQQGVDVIVSAAGSSDFGAFTAAAEHTAATGTQVWAIGLDNDQWFAVPPNEQSAILTSIIKRVDVGAFRLIEHMTSGGPNGLVASLSVADDAYGVSTQGDDFTPEMSAALDEIMTEITEGRVDLCQRPDGSGRPCPTRN